MQSQKRIKHMIQYVVIQISEGRCRMFRRPMKLRSFFFLLHWNSNSRTPTHTHVSYQLSYSLEASYAPDLFLYFWTVTRNIFLRNRKQESCNLTCFIYSLHIVLLSFLFVTDSDINRWYKGGRNYNCDKCNNLSDGKSCQLVNTIVMYF